MLYKLGEDLDCDVKRLKFQLRQSIFQVDEWDANYLWLFENTMDLYSFKDLEGLVNSVFNHYRNQANYDTNILKILAKIAVKYLFICQEYKREDFEDKKAIDFLVGMPVDSEIFFEKIEGQYFKAKLDKNQKLMEEITDFCKRIYYKEK